MIELRYPTLDDVEPLTAAVRESLAELTPSLPPRRWSRSMRIVPLTAASLLLAGTLAQATPPFQASRIDRLSWMAGCWELRMGVLLVEEQWMPPRGGLMLGMGRTMMRDRLAGYEQLLIGEDSTGLVFRATPSDQPPAEFHAAELADSSVTFENPAHDFPQRVIYRSAAGGDSLLARVEGTVDGTLRGSDFHYGRVACAR